MAFWICSDNVVMNKKTLLFGTRQVVSRKVMPRFREVSQSKASTRIALRYFAKPWHDFAGNHPSSAEQADN